MSFFEEAKQMQEEAKKNNLKDKNNTELIKGLEEASNIRDRQLKRENILEELYQRAIRNTQISESEKVKINKSDFADKDEVIDILLYSVARMTQDELFYKANIQKLKGHTPLYKEAE